MKVSFLGFAFGFVLGFVSPVAGTTELHQNDAIKQKAADLDVSLGADKHAYKPGDRIKLEVLLVNKNAVKDIFVYGTLQFGVRASFRLFRRDAKGKEVPTRFIDDAWELPPKSSDVTAFVKLLPFHFLGTDRQFTC